MTEPVNGEKLAEARGWENGFNIAEQTYGRVIEQLRAENRKLQDQVTRLLKEKHELEESYYLMQRHP